MESLTLKEDPVLTSHSLLLPDFAAMVIELASSTAWLRGYVRIPYA
jgi:hypothetical protein